MPSNISNALPRRIKVFVRFSNLPPDLRCQAKGSQRDARALFCNPGPWCSHEFREFWSITQYDSINRLHFAGEHGTASAILVLNVPFFCHAHHGEYHSNNPPMFREQKGIECRSSMNSHQRLLNDPKRLDVTIITVSCTATSTRVTLIRFSAVPDSQIRETEGHQQYRKVITLHPPAAADKC